MTLICQEEVFSWFRTLSGAKRIELMCGLFGLCIPLEVRYFEAVLQEAAKKDYNGFRDAELKANSRQELENICKCDLLAEKNDFDDLSQMNGNGGDGSTNSLANDPPKVVPKYSSRSKLIISLCLLSPTNHMCATMTYGYIEQQLNPQKLYHAMMNIFIPKNYPIDDIFSEIILLLTMAIYHPAFSYEERDLLTKQKEDTEEVMRLIHTLRQSTLSQVVGIQSAATGAMPGPVPGTQPSGPQPYASQAAAAAAAVAAAHQQHIVAAAAAAAAHTQHQYGGGGGPHGPSVVSTTNAGASSKAPPHIAHHMHHPQATFPMFSAVPIANLTYTPQPAPPPPPPPQPPSSQQHQPPSQPQSAGGSDRAQAVSNATNNNMPNMSILRINSPPSISSASSPSPTISPSSAKIAAANVTAVPHSNPHQHPHPQQQQLQQSTQSGPSQSQSSQQASIVAMKLDPTTTTTSMYGTVGTPAGLPPNSVITFVGGDAASNSVVSRANPFSLSIPQHSPAHHVIVEDVTPQSKANNSGPMSCFNCGNVGHRGGDCTSGGDDSNR